MRNCPHLASFQEVEGPELSSTGDSLCAQPCPACPSVPCTLMMCMLLLLVYIISRGRKQKVKKRRPSRIQPLAVFVRALCSNLSQVNTQQEYSGCSVTILSRGNPEIFLEEEAVSWSLDKKSFTWASLAVACFLCSPASCTLSQNDLIGAGTRLQPLSLSRLSSTTLLTILAFPFSLSLLSCPISGA